MSSIFVRALALILSVLLFAMARYEHSFATEGFLGGGFFLSLFIGAFFERKFFELTMGILLLFPPGFGLVTGTVFGLGKVGRHFGLGNKRVLENDPSGFLLTVCAWLAISISLISYGIYSVSKEKGESPGSGA